MAQRKLKRGTNLDGTYYPPGSKVDDEVFTNPKLYLDPESPEPVSLPDADEPDEVVPETDTRVDPDEVEEGSTSQPAEGPPQPTGEGSKPAPVKKAPAKKATTKKAPAKKAASSS